MKTKLYVKNLSFDTDSIDLTKLFSTFGEVLSINVPQNKSSGMSKGYALVEMKNQKDAESVIKNLNETIFKDFKIKITIAYE